MDHLRNSSNQNKIPVNENSNKYYTLSSTNRFENGNNGNTNNIINNNNNCENAKHDKSSKGMLDKNKDKALVENMKMNNINVFNSNNFENIKARLKDVSYSEIDESNISESDKLSSYAPSEKTKGKELFN